MHACWTDLLPLICTTPTWERRKDQSHSTDGELSPRWDPMISDWYFPPGGPLQTFSANWASALHPKYPAEGTYGKAMAPIHLLLSCAL